MGRRADPDHVRILDPVTDEPLPTGEVGTVYLKAPAVGRFDYFGDPDKTASSYRGDYFTMGDVGYLDEDGYLFLTDRSADLIITGGVNVYPAEVEAELLGPSRGRRRRGHRRARRRVGRDRGGGGRARRPGWRRPTTWPRR